MTATISLTTASIPELIRWACQQTFALQLSPDRICFLIAIYASHSDQAEGTFTEVELAAAFQAVQVCFQSLGKKHALQVNSVINEFVEQRLLNRFTGDWMAEGAVYRLSSLGLAIAEQYLKQKNFSVMRFSFQLQQISKELAAVAQTLETQPPGDALNKSVLMPLHYNVAEIFDGIDRAQRALDQSQHEVKVHISQLISQQWASAIASCEQLLAETSSVLSEVRDTLEATGNGLQAQLLALQKSHLASPKVEGLDTLLSQFQHKMDRILQWGESTITLWIQFDKQVHRFIREMLAINQNQRLALKLTASIKQFLQYPFSLVVCAQDRLIDYEPRAWSGPTTKAFGALPPALVLEEASFALKLQCEYFFKTCLAQFPLGSPAMLEAVRTQIEALPQADKTPFLHYLLAFCSQSGYASKSFVGLSAPWQRLHASPSLSVQFHEFDYIQPID